MQWKNGCERVLTPYHRLCEALLLCSQCCECDVYFIYRMACASCVCTYVFGKRWGSLEVGMNGCQECVECSVRIVPHGTPAKSTSQHGNGCSREGKHYPLLGERERIFVDGETSANLFLGLWEVQVANHLKGWSKSFYSPPRVPQHDATPHPRLKEKGTKILRHKVSLWMKGSGKGFAYG
jgi:hypothetical protein